MIALPEFEAFCEDSDLVLSRLNRQENRPPMRRERPAATGVNVATVIHETEPGYFPAADGAAPFPMAIRLDVPEPGHLVYSWSYGGRGEPMRVRDVGDVRRVS